MIRRPHDDGWILIRQNDHAAMSGALMARWGNDAFAPPTPHAEVLLGIVAHDNGWDEWDTAPDIHGETGYPLQFTELTSEAYVTIWRRSVEHHRRKSPYAAVLITLHSEHLARRRLERVLGHAVAEEAAPLTAFIAEMQTLRLELTHTVMAQSTAVADQLGAEIKANFRLLQIGDFVSLQLCRGISGPFNVDQVPVQARGPFLSVTFEPASEDMLVVAPYPFSETDVVVAISGRVLRKKVFASTAELQDDLRGADPISLTFRLKPA